MADGSIRVLSVGGSASFAAAAIAPAAVRLAYGYWNGSVLALAWAMTVGPTLCILVAIAEERSVARSSRHFEPKLLAGGAVLLAVATLALCTTGVFGALVCFLLAPVAVAAITTSWTQPKDPDVPIAVIFGLALTPLLAWFLGRADEYVSEALVSGGLMVTVVVGLIVLRRRGAADRS